MGIKITCDICESMIPEILYQNFDKRHYILWNNNKEMDLCSNCYKRLLEFLNSRRSSNIPNQIKFPEFVTEEKDEEYFKSLEKDDPQPWKNK